MGSDSKGVNEVLCPRCEAHIALEKYAAFVEMGVDGVREQCRVCGTISVIAFTHDAAGHAHAAATIAS